MIIHVLGSEMRSVFADIINLANMKIWRKSGMIIMISRMMKVAQVNFFHSFQLLLGSCNQFMCKATLKTNYISDLNLEQLPFNMKIDHCSKHFFLLQKSLVLVAKKLWMKEHYWLIHLILVLGRVIFSQDLVQCFCLAAAIAKTLKEYCFIDESVSGPGWGTGRRQDLALVIVFIC